MPCLLRKITIIYLIFILLIYCNHLDAADAKQTKAIALRGLRHIGDRSK